MSKTDSQLREDIQTELHWDPKVNPTQIGVSVNKGEVTLFGTVETYPQKWAAAQAAKRIFGVRNVVEDLGVRLPAKHSRKDSEIGAAVEHALEWDVFTPNSVTAHVVDGAVTLEGEVEWNFERERAETVVRYLSDVTAVYNLISLKPSTSALQVKEKIQSALERQVTTDTNSIHIDTAGGKVTLTGHASSWQTIEDAANAAWAAPGSDRGYRPSEDANDVLTHEEKP